jgi:DNA-binding NtrC family response regulator
MRVLVVDDETQVRRIREQLASRGIEVVGTPCADDAFRLWQSEAPWALVVTEFRVTPGEKIRDGMELMKAIRATSGSQRIAIHTSDEGLLASPVPVLLSPHSIEQLLRMLGCPCCL